MHHWRERDAMYYYFFVKHERVNKEGREFFFALKMEEVPDNL